MQKTTFSDHLFSGSSFSGVLTIEDLIPLSNITCSNNVVCCLVSQEKLKEEFAKRSREFSLKTFKWFLSVFDEPIVVQNTYFNVETNSFEEQQVIFTLVED